MRFATVSISTAVTPRGMRPTKRTRDPKDALNAYLAELDPLGDSDRSAAVRLALASSSDGRFGEFLNRLGQPGYRSHSLAAIATTCDLSLAEFIHFWHRTQLQRVLSMAHDAMLDVIDDLIENASYHDVSCSRCDGRGRVTTGKGRNRVCPVCRGAGSVRMPGDAHARDCLLQIAGFGKKGLAAVQITFGGAAMESAVDGLKGITFDVSDPEVTDEEPESSKLE